MAKPKGALKGAEQEAPSGAPDFKALLKQQADEVVRPPPIPAGTWGCQIQSHTFGKSAKKQTPYVQFAWALMEPGPDIDTAELEDFKHQGKVIKQDFYVTEDALYRLREFFENLGCEVQGKSLEELVQDSTGLPGMLSISNRPSDNPNSDAVYAQIDSVAAPE